MSIDKNVSAERIRKLRHRRNMTQEELAEAADLSVVYIGNLECGARLPSLDTILRLCHILDCTPDELLEGFYPDRNKPDARSFLAMFEHSTYAEKQFMLKVSDAFIHYLKDTLK